MKHPYKSMETLSIYDQERAVFAEMKEQMQNRKRRARRRRMLMWVLRRL
ncbi:hypothetical protein [uncultured Tateyamaria sp.]|nr:hypothetical protein [uncultured Tateyamaria sp.]